MHLHWLIALFGFKITYADKVSAFLYLRASCKSGSLMSIDTAWTDVPVSNSIDYLLPLPKSRVFFSVFPCYFFVFFADSMLRHHLGSIWKQNFQCLGATGLTGLATPPLEQSKIRRKATSAKLTFFPMVSNVPCVDSRKKCEFVDLGKLSMSRDQVMVSEEVPGAQKKCKGVASDASRIFKDLPSALFQVTKTGGDMR